MRARRRARDRGRQETIEDAAPVVGLGNETVRINGRTLKAPVEGVTPAWGRIRNRVPEAGRYIVERDVDDARHRRAHRPEAQAGASSASEEALGREILIRGVRFRIVGVLQAASATAR